jgi:hypothetical protein
MRKPSFPSLLRRFQVGAECGDGSFISGKQIAPPSPVADGLIADLTSVSRVNGMGTFVVRGLSLGCFESNSNGNILRTIFNKCRMNTLYQFT